MKPLIILSGICLALSFLADVNKMWSGNKRDSFDGFVCEECGEMPVYGVAELT